ncbi:DNA-directed RNA polymerase subunit omega [Desulfitibacter alkalitolerans]|uniref:DNA-directed RNA polymerase subunit omega n=1 Tax=Desulfitibacter alkalitolerans TaxID=264641 RepID=UPI0006884ADF|nr:DNA-directed RNA polymerase subunit omega [Desulfitibacter alkalitolerans]
MNQPPLDLLLQKVDNKYSLVVKSAKRARRITEGEIKDENGIPLKGKPVTLALYEIATREAYCPENNGNQEKKRG